MTSTEISLGIDDSGGSSTSWGFREMATYAAYRHVELDKVGCGKRSIMKPPGGDCHDIFGADFHGTPSHHRVLKPPGGGTSGLFATSLDETDRRSISTSSEGSASQGSQASVNGIEGKTNGVNGKTGNDSLSDEPKGSKDADVDSVTKTCSSLSADSKSVSQEDKRRRDGNPVTGEGYDTPETQPPAPQRARIPPGGYSSGLW